MKNKKYLQRKFSRKVLVPQSTADFTLRVSKSCVRFTCKFPMVIHFVPILHRSCRSKTNFYVFFYEKTSLKLCASFSFFLAIFMEKFQKIRYLNYMRRGIVSFVFNQNINKQQISHAGFMVQTTLKLPDRQFLLVKFKSGW